MWQCRALRSLYACVRTYSEQILIYEMTIAYFNSNALKFLIVKLTHTSNPIIMTNKIKQKEIVFERETKGRLWNATLTLFQIRKISEKGQGRGGSE